MNNCVFVGNITRIDDDLQMIGSGEHTSEKIRFGMALQRNFKNKDGEYEADFINCEAWGRTAEFIHKYFVKGQKIAIIGQFRNNNYINKDGNKIYSDFIYVDSAEFASSKADNANVGNRQTNNSNNTTSKDDFIDIPGNIEEALPFN